MQTLYSGFVDALIRFRTFWLVVVAALSVLAALQFPNLQVDNSNESLFRDGDNAKQVIADFKATFGNDDVVLILVEMEAPFTPTAMTRLQDFADTLETEVPHLAKLTWVGNVETVEGIPGGILIDQLVPGQNYAEIDLAAIQARATTDPIYKDRIVSADGKAIGLVLDFLNYPDDHIDPRKDAPPILNDIVSRFPDLETYMVGGPVIDYEMDELLIAEGPKWVALSIVAMALMLAFTTRSLRGVIVPTLTVVISVLWTMGLISLFGYSVNMVVLMVPVLLLCVGVGDSMHVVAEFGQHYRRGASRRDALVQTLQLVGLPLFLTSVTTAAGFLAFLATDMKPLQNLGVQATMGVFIALLLTYIFAVPALAFGKPYAAPKNTDKAPRTADMFDIFLAAIGRATVNAPGKIVLGFVALTALAAYGASILQIESNVIHDLPEDQPMRAQYDYVDQRMAGSMTMEVVVQTDLPGGIKNIEVMREIEMLETYLATHPHVTQTSSIASQIMQMNRAIHENDPAFLRLPETSNQVAEYLLLYESGGGDALDRFVSFPYDKARVQVRTTAMSLNEIVALEEDALVFAAANLEHSSAAITGTVSLLSKIGVYVAEGQVKSFLLAFIAVTLIMMLTLRSPVLALIAMTPNVLPAFFAIGVLGLVGVELNVILIVLAPLILGVAVDDTVHFFTRFRRNFEQSGVYADAYQATIVTVGRPLLFTTIVLIAGFSGFYISIFKGPSNLSWAAGLAFATALIGQFTLAPILLRWLKPLGPERGAAAHAPTSPTQAQATQAQATQAKAGAAE